MCCTHSPQNDEDLLNPVNELEKIMTKVAFGELLNESLKSDYQNYLIYALI